MTGLHLTALQLAQTMCMLLEKVAICLKYACFKRNSCNWLSICVFQLKKFQLVLTMCSLVKIDVIVSDCVLCLKKLQLAQTMCDSFEIEAIVATGSDYACFI